MTALGMAVQNFLPADRMGVYDLLTDRNDIQHFVRKFNKIF